MNKFGTAIILAGGKSNRMGFDKQKINIGKAPLIDQILEKLTPIFSEIIVVTNTPEYYIGRNCITVKDEIAQHGPLSGIHAGLKRSSSQFAYVIACDMPNINEDYLLYMMDLIDSSDSKACVTLENHEWIEPFNAFYSKDIIEDIEIYLHSNKKSVFHLLKGLNCAYIPEEVARKFDPNWDMFTNLNTKEELDRFLNEYYKNKKN